MKAYDPQDAFELANQLQELIVRLPSDTNPHTIMTALCAMIGRGIALLEPHDQEPALEWAMETIRLGMQRAN